MDHKENNWSYGNIPEFGAIFMSNIQTKKECLKRKIFALPSSHTEFVTHIKAGMVLFLFEFRTRQLFGVYQASSDGAVDIIPHAFNYSGQRFPAQVRFRQIWHCDPLSEKEFRDAITENYFSANKFNFGLSEDQVRRLLYLFSSRKTINKMPPQSRSEAMVEVAVKDRRLVDDDRLELSERGYMAPAEYDEINRVAFRVHRVSSLARGIEDEVLVDDSVNAEGKVYPFPQDDFLAKRRRIGKEGTQGRLTTNNAVENGLYTHGYRRTFCTDSSKDSLDDVRRLVNAHKSSTVQMVNENQVNEMYNPIQSSEHSLDPSDVRALDDYSFMQRSRLLDDCNMRNGCQPAFASDYYGNSVGQSKYSINDDRFLLDDSGKTDCTINVAISSANSDYNLNLCREAREIKKDQEWLMNRELENGHHLDCDGSTISAFNPSVSLLHKTRKTSAAGRFQMDEAEPKFGTCSGEDFSSENVLHQLQSVYRIIEGRKYPIVAGRSTENMVDKVPPILATNAGYIASADRPTIDNGMFGKSERLGNQEASHTHTNPVMSMKYPSFSQLEQNLPSLSDKLVPEKQLPQFTVSRNLNLLHSAFDDATITRAVPYLPDHPNLSHGCTASIEANQNSTSMHKKHPHDGSLGDFYSNESNRSQQYFLEPEKSSRPLDTTLEFGNKGLALSTSGLRSSLLQESTNSHVNPIFFSDMDLNTSAPDNYRGSLPSNISPPRAGLENLEGGKGLLAYYSKSRDHHFAFDGYLPEASKNQSKHVPQHGMVMLSGKDFSCSESKFQPETDLAVYEKQYFRFSSNKNLKEPNKFYEANSTFTRKSVFTRLSSKESSQFGVDRNDFDVNPQDCYMDATADEVMQMLQQDNNLSLRKLRKSRFVGQQPRESAVNEKKSQSHMEIDHSTIEKKNLNSASQSTTVDCMDEIPKETRILDFKRRSDRKKNLVGIGVDPASHSKTTGSNEEVKSSTSSNLRRKRLVRPVFGKIDTATDALHDSSETLQIPPLILDKDYEQGCQITISLCESEIPRSSNVLALHTRQEMDCNKEPLYPKEHKDVVAHLSPSTSIDLKGHEQANDDLHIGSSNALKETSMQKGQEQANDDGLHIGSSNVLKETSMQKGHEQANDDDLHIGCSNVLKETSMQKGHEHTNDDDLHIGSSNVLKETSLQKSLDVQASVADVLAKDTDTTVTGLNLLESSLEGFKLGAGCGSNLVGDDLHIGSSNVLKETSMQKGHEQANDDLHVGSSNVLKEMSQRKRLDIQTSVAGVLAKDTDTTITGLNLPESSLEGFKLGAGCGNNLIKEKRLKKMKIVLTTKTDVNASSQ